MKNFIIILFTLFVFGCLAPRADNPHPICDEPHIELTVTNDPDFICHIVFDDDTDKYQYYGCSVLIEEDCSCAIFVAPNDFETYGHEYAHCMFGTWEGEYPEE